MLLSSDCNVVGSSKGQGQRGEYYNVAVVVEGEAYNLNCTAEVYGIAQGIEFGTDMMLTVDLRRYGRDWGVRVVGLSKLEE